MASKYPPGVTRRDVITWLRIIPRIEDWDGTYARYYIKHYDVVGKIVRAKQQGKWPPVRHTID